MINQTTITSKKEFKRLIDEMIVCIGMAEAIESLIINVHFHSIGNKQGKQTDECRVFFSFFWKATTQMQILVNSAQTQNK